MRAFDYEYHEAERERLIQDEIEANIRAGMDAKEAEALAEHDVPSVWELYQDALAEHADAVYEARREASWEN